MVLAVMGAMLPPIPPSTQQSCDCLSRREVSTFIPSQQPFCALHCAQPDCFLRKSGSTLRVIPTLMCARVTSLDSAQALPKYREESGFSPSSPTAGVTLPRPPLRTFSPKNPTKEKHPPWTLSSEGLPPRHLLNYCKSELYNF